jgi:hypothetical protein
MHWCSSSRRSAGLPAAGSIKSSKVTRNICEDHQKAPPLRPPQLAASFHSNATCWHFSDVADLTDNVGSWQIVLQKSFCRRCQKF